MKKALNQTLRLALAATMTITLLSGCERGSNTPTNASPSAAGSSAEPNSAAMDKKVALLKDISGVWNPTSTVGLTTIYFADNRFQILQGDTPLAVTVGDVDPDAETVNVNTRIRGKDEILTFRKMWNTDHTAYNLSMTGSDGMQETLGFVRRISNDDLNRIARLSIARTSAPQPSQLAEATPVAASANRGVVDMWLGGIDMNLRSCPGSTCSALMILPKDSKVSVDTSTIRDVTESSGNNTPWVRVTYEGAYCTPAELDQQTGCAPSHGTEAPATGWMNYTRLMPAPRVQE